MEFPLLTGSQLLGSLWNLDAFVVILRTKSLESLNWFWPKLWLAAKACTGRHLPFPFASCLSIPGPALLFTFTGWG
jgi:hypothetical protein